MNFDSARDIGKFNSSVNVGKVRRRQDIEVLRLICAMGIVFYHAAKSGNSFYYSALIVFLMLSIMLAGSKPEFGWVNIKRRASRLLMPWLVWFTIYALFNSFRQRAPIPIGDGIVLGILSGSSLHLWFMPFIFFCLVIVDFFRTQLNGITLCRVSALLSVLIIFTSSYWRPFSETLALPFPQWIHASLAILIGVVFINANCISRLELIFLLGSIVGVLLSVLQQVTYAFPYIVGIAVCLTVHSGVARKLKDMQISKLTDAALGIYFVHMLLLKGLIKTPVGSTTYLPFCVFALSLLLVVAGRAAFPRLAKYWS